MCLPPLLQSNKNLDQLRKNGIDMGPKVTIAKNFLHLLALIDCLNFAGLNCLLEFVIKHSSIIVIISLHFIIFCNNV